MNESPPAIHAHSRSGHQINYLDISAVLAGAIECRQFASGDRTVTATARTGTQKNGVLTVQWRDEEYSWRLPELRMAGESQALEFKQQLWTRMAGRYNSRP